MQKGQAYQGSKMNLGQCSLCKRSIKPLKFYTNPFCAHIYCRNCIFNRHVPNKSKIKCFVDDCQFAITVDDMDEHFMKLQLEQMQVKVLDENCQIESKMNQGQCSLCKNLTTLNKFYTNPFCGHIYCRSCICNRLVPNKLKMKCFVDNCQFAINVDDMDEHFMKLQLEQMEEKEQLNDFDEKCQGQKKQPYTMLKIHIKKHQF